MIRCVGHFIFQPLGVEESVLQGEFQIMSGKKDASHPMDALKEPPIYDTSQDHHSGLKEAIREQGVHLPVPSLRRIKYLAIQLRLVAPIVLSKYRCFFVCLASVSAVVSHEIVPPDATSNRPEL